MGRKFYTILRDNSKSLAIVPENTQMVALQPAGERSPLFMVDSYPNFIDVVKLTGADQPVLSLISHDEAQGSDSYSIADEASMHIKLILIVSPMDRTCWVAAAPRASLPMRSRNNCER